jgi:hypothetical protein
VLSLVGVDRGVFGCDCEVLADAGASPGNLGTREICRKKVAASYRLTPIKPAMIGCPGQRVHDDNESMAADQVVAGQIPGRPAAAFGGLKQLVA